MKWSKNPYELEDGTVEEGLMAAALRSLDAFDPTSPKRRAAPTGEGLKQEAVNFLDGARWCPALGGLVVRSGPDMHAMKDEGHLRNLLGVLLSARVVWSARELARHPDEPRAKTYARAAADADRRGVGRDLLDSVKERLRIDAGELDAAPDVIGTPSGVFSLADGELLCEAEMLEASLSGRAVDDFESAALMVTKSTRAPFESPMLRIEFDYDERWDAFVDEICDGDGEKASFLQRALGYSLYGGNPEKATFVLWSRKRNCGKSTLMEIVKHALGDYAASAPVEMLLKGERRRDYSAPNPVLVELKGKRLVDMSEPPAGAMLDGAALKKLTSGLDHITARGLQKDPISYVPEFAPWLHCNSLPLVDDPTAVDPERVFVVEFTRSFEGSERDFGLVARFETERGMHTVMSWLSEGYARYLERGLDAPPDVRAATEAWLVSSGTWLDSFVAECCVLDVREKYPLTPMRKAMEAYRREVGGDRMSKSAVDSYLQLLNVPNTTSNGTRYFRGIALTEEAVKRLLPPDSGERKGTIPLG